jgi:hypothetical protein
MTIYRSAEGHEQIRAWCRGQLERWERAHDNRLVATALGDTHVLAAVV